MTVHVGGPASVPEWPEQHNTRDPVSVVWIGSARGPWVCLWGLPSGRSGIDADTVPPPLPPVPPKSMGIMMGCLIVPLPVGLHSSSVESRHVVRRPSGGLLVFCAKM